MIGMPNPPATTTGATPAWVPMTEAQRNTLTEAQWNTFTDNNGATPQALSARYHALNCVVLITNGTQKVSEHVYDARVIKSPPTYPPTNARNLHPGNALSKPGKRRNPGFSGVSVSIRNAKGYLYGLIIRWFRVQVPAAPLIFRGFRAIGNPCFVKCHLRRLFGVQSCRRCRCFAAKENSSMLTFLVALNLCSELIQFLFERMVTAIEMIHAADFGMTFRCQCRQHQRGTGAQV